MNEVGVGDRDAELLRAWNSDRTPFSAWVRAVNDAFATSRLQTEGAARLVRATSAEIEAVLRLGLMDDGDLELLDPAVPPKTTWFDIAEATTEGISAALEALSRRRDSDAPSRVVRDAIREVDGPEVSDRIAALSADVFTHMAKKAAQYSLLSDRNRRFFDNMAGRRRAGRPLTPKQLAKAEKFMLELRDGGALRRPSPDGDQAIVDSVLDALES